MKFEDLQVWQRSMRLGVDILKGIADCRNYALRDQMTRASLSIPSNIAEGFERESHRDFIRFLRIARGSCGELRTQLYLAREIGILSREDSTRHIAETREIAAMISSLVNYRLACERKKQSPDRPT